MCLYFLDLTTFEGDISPLLFPDYMKVPGNPLTKHKLSKSPYLTQMTSDPKNKGTLFHSTLKVEEINLQLFFGSDII
jgi:hypothetical protein